MGVLDTDPQSIASYEDGILVADAGGNSLLSVDGSGTVSLVAVFPPAMQEFPAEMLAAMGPPPDADGEMAPEGEAMAEGEEMAPEGDEMAESDEMPADGAYYVGQLTGFPFPVGGASVYRVAPGGEPEVYASGFTNIIDIGFGPDETL